MRKFKLNHYTKLKNSYRVHFSSEIKHSFTSEDKVKSFLASVSRELNDKILDVIQVSNRVFSFLFENIMYHRSLYEYDMVLRKIELFYSRSTSENSNSWAFKDIQGVLSYLDEMLVRFDDETEYMKQRIISSKIRSLRNEITQIAKDVELIFATGTSSDLYNFKSYYGKLRIV